MPSVGHLGRAAGLRLRAQHFVGSSGTDVLFVPSFFFFGRSLSLLTLSIGAGREAGGEGNPGKQGIVSVTQILVFQSAAFQGTELD